MSNVVPFEITQSAPVLYERAKQAMAECYQIDEVITWRDKAAALKEYARQRDDEELLKLAHKIHGRAVARVGELLAAIEPKPGARMDREPTESGHSRLQTRKEAAAEAGLTEHQAVQALRMANVPEDTREALLEERVPINQIADLGRTSKPAPAKPLFDLKGLDARQYKQGTQLYGLMEYTLQHLQAVKDPVRAFREGMHPNDQQRFLAMTSKLLHLLEALDHEIR